MVPTWTELYTTYLATGTAGGCPACHSEASTASGAYMYLTTEGQIAGSSSALVSPTLSCFSWLGGGMPPKGPSSDPTAVTAFQAWACAGAPNN
jgi:hypothetical protein